MQFRQALLAATVLSLAVVSGAAQAQVSGLYIGMAAGASRLGDARTSNHPVGRYSMDNNSQGDTNILGRGFRGSFNMGVNGLVNMGYGFGNGFRAELEGFYRANGVNAATYYTSGTYTGNLTTNAGTLRTYGAMANIYYDIDPNFFPESMRFFQPYVGIGLGYGYAQFQGVKGRRVETNNNGNQTNYYEVDANKAGGNLAYQAILGAAFAIDSVAPGLAVTAEYRYQGMLAVPLAASVYQVNTNSGQGTQRRLASTDSYKPTFSGSAFMVGVRYALDAAEAPGVAANLPVGWSAPVAPQARTYMVFFANNSAALDIAGRQVIAEAVQSARTVATTSIQLVGHADGTGRGPRNQQLSAARVQSVTGELVRLGVPRNAIAGAATGAAGSSGADPQARRVDIVLR